ncbi:DHBP synthase RibB-like alpha/beta domain-containing protein [Ochromonadaceae sp. CCMP2298]|nr:DHBP synthase RibB-like alpha/beta domain-containing protein [Ochromonadaceae sp. CCMP2298]
MDNLLIPPTEEGLAIAAQLIRSGGLVAFPTETVYGLGANALDAAAVQSIFTAKGRPLTDPLIVHVATPEDALDLIELNETEAEVYRLLIAAFWPGPLTLIAKASARVPSLVTAGTGFVGVRCPRHALAKRLLVAAQVPIAAPSANRFGHVSPTTAAHVLTDLGAKGVHVLDGEAQTQASDASSDSSSGSGNCEFGIESSVVKIDAQGMQLIIFRQGGVTEPQLLACLRRGLQQGELSQAWKVVAVQRAVKMHSTEGPATSTQHTQHTAPSGPTASATAAAVEEASMAGAQQAPGQAITHYAPDVPCVSVRSMLPRTAEGAGGSLADAGAVAGAVTVTGAELGAGCVLVDFGAQLAPWQSRCLAYRDLSQQGSAAEAARRLFDTLRWAETVPHATRVFIAAIPSTPAISPVSESARQSAGAGGGELEADLTLGLADRIFRAASGVTVDIIVV